MSSLTQIALIWILGEYGYQIELAPYYLENLVKDLAGAQTEHPSVDYKLAVGSLSDPSASDCHRQVVHQATARGAPSPHTAVHALQREPTRRRGCAHKNRVLLQHAEGQPTRTEAGVRRRKGFSEVQRQPLRLRRSLRCSFSPKPSSSTLWRSSTRSRRKHSRSRSSTS